MGAVVDGLRVAYHEAGHAVVAYVLNGRISRVSVVPNDETVGRCQSAPPFFPGVTLSEDQSSWSRQLAKARARERILVLLAGGAAEKHATGTYSGMKHDFAGAIKVAEVLSPNNPLYGVGTMVGRADRLIKRNWRAVKALAEALIKRGTIDGDEAEDIIASALSASAARLSGKDVG